MLILVLRFISGENQKKIHSTKTDESQPLTSQTPGETHNHGEPAPSTNERQDEPHFTWENQREGSNNELKPSSKGDSFSYQGQEPDIGGNEAASTSLSQVRPLPSQNQGASKAGDQIPATNTSSGQSLPSPNQGAGKDGDKIPAADTSPAHSLPHPNKETGKDGEEIPATNTDKEQKKKTLEVRHRQ